MSDLAVGASVVSGSWQAVAGGPAGQADRRINSAHGTSLLREVNWTARGVMTIACTSGMVLPREERVKLRGASIQKPGKRIPNSRNEAIERHVDASCLQICYIEKRSIPHSLIS
jgi:hypothetical protein